MLELIKKWYHPVFELYAVVYIWKACTHIEDDKPNWITYVVIFPAMIFAIDLTYKGLTKFLCWLKTLLRNREVKKRERQEFISGLIACLNNLKINKHSHWQVIHMLKEALANGTKLSHEIKQVKDLLSLLCETHHDHRFQEILRGQ